MNISTSLGTLVSVLSSRYSRLDTLSDAESHSRDCSVEQRPENDEHANTDELGDRRVEHGKKAEEESQEGHGEDDVEGGARVEEVADSGDAWEGQRTSERANEDK
jgi:hypothetical protein